MELCHAVKPKYIMSSHQIGGFPRQDADLHGLLLHPGSHLEGPVTPLSTPNLLLSLFQVLELTGQLHRQLAPVPPWAVYFGSLPVSAR